MPTCCKVRSMPVMMAICCIATTNASALASLLPVAWGRIMPASSAYKGAATGALKRNTCGKTSEFDSPCATWNTPPIGYASAWTAATGALENACPASVAPSSIACRAARLAPSSQATIRLLNSSPSAWRAGIELRRDDRHFAGRAGGDDGDVGHFRTGAGGGGDLQQRQPPARHLVDTIDVG